MTQKSHAPVSVTQALLEPVSVPQAPTPPASVLPAFDGEIERAVRIYSRRLIGIAGFVEHNLDDIRQEMRLELLARFSSFDPRRAQRSTFIARVLEHKAGQIVRHRIAEKRDYRREEYSLNDAIRDPDGRKIMRVQNLTDADCSGRLNPSVRPPVDHGAQRETLALAMARLTEPQRAICMRLMHVSQKQLCRETGMSVRALQRHLREIRQCMKHAGLRADLEE